MGRRPEYDTDEVLDAASVVFSRSGYEGTSVDELVAGLGVHRGSLYKAFGSKRGLFLSSLTRHVDTQVAACAEQMTSIRRPRDRARWLVESDVLDLVAVAAIERGPHDPQVAALVEEALELLEEAWRAASTANPSPAAASAVLAVRCLLGTRIATRMHGPRSNATLDEVAKGLGEKGVL
jgi:TetR/AcrR family transcriptional repressor of nem operon